MTMTDAVGSGGNLVERETQYFQQDNETGGVRWRAVFLFRPKTVERWGYIYTHHPTGPRTTGVSYRLF